MTSSPSKSSTESLIPKADDLTDPTSRLIAVVIDRVLPIPMFFALFGVKSIEPKQVIALFAIGILVFVQFYFISTRGQSLGKMLLRIRIVDKRTGKINGFLRSVFLRNIVNSCLKIIPLYPVVDALFVFSKHHCCIHDHIAGTYVFEAYKPQLDHDVSKPVAIVGSLISGVAIALGVYALLKFLISGS